MAYRPAGQKIPSVAGYGSLNFVARTSSSVSLFKCLVLGVCRFFRLAPLSEIRRANISDDFIARELGEQWRCTVISRIHAL